jgi:phosphoribosylamine--glycine ligase
MWVFKPENNQDLDLTYVEMFPGEIYTKMSDEWSRRIGDQCKYILQKKIDGLELSSEVWIGRAGPVHFNRTFEDKRMMAGNLGPAIGSQSNTVWVERDLDSVAIDQLTKMAGYLRKNNYIGPCDVNMIVKNGIPYFLEWSPRFGYDAIYCLLELVKGKLSGFFEKEFEVDFYPGYAASQRISVPPFPYATPSLLSTFAKDVTIMGKLDRLPRFWGQDIYYNIDHLACAGTDGILGVVTGRGESLGAAWGNVYRSIDKMNICSYLQYRKDGCKSHEKRLSLFNKVSRRKQSA